MRGDEIMRVRNALVVALVCWLSGLAQGQGLEALARATRNFRPATAIVAAQEEIVGDWFGTLEAPGLPVIFHISETDGSLTATLDSPSQGAAGIPIDSVVFDNGHLSLRIAAIGGGYEGQLGSDGTIVGSWSQGGLTLDLTLERNREAAAAPNRPQEPQEPFPYEAETVRIVSSVPGVILAGTLTLPPAEASSPAVILISGSGPQDRDETLLGHRPFLVLADHLTRQGVAVLRLDDRGVGESTGVFATATTSDFAADILAAVEFLDRRPDIGPIGLIGHSEGGLVAPMVANRAPGVNFVVLMAGPGLTGEEILYRQGVLIIKANGGSDEAAETNREAQAALFAVVKEEEDVEVARVRLRDILLESLAQVTAGDENLESQVQAQLAQLTQPWFRYFLTYDPLPALRELDCPVLAINGEKDTQVPPKENLEAIRRALGEGGNADFDIVELPGLNHLFQTADTGSPNEYASIEETMSPRALQTMTNWILARFPRATP